MKKQEAKILSIFARYIIIILAGLGNLWIFYKILTPLTIKTTAFILNFFSETGVYEDLIFFSAATIRIIPACVAGSAYYLLLILILTTPNIKPKTISRIILFSFTSLFVLNTLRVAILTLIVNSIYFESIHLIFWYGVSTIFVVTIWILSVKLFKIKDVPVYDDFKFLLKTIKKSKRRR